MLDFEEFSDPEESFLVNDFSFLELFSLFKNTLLDALEDMLWDNFDEGLLDLFFWEGQSDMFLFLWILIFSSDIWFNLLFVLSVLRSVFNVNLVLFVSSILDVSVDVNSVLAVSAVKYSNKLLCVMFELFWDKSDSMSWILFGSTSWKFKKSSNEGRAGRLDNVVTSLRG